MRVASPPVPIALLLQDLELHGTQRQMLALASRLNRSLFSPKIVTLCGGKMPFSAHAEALGLECVHLTDEPVFKPAKALPALWCFLRKERPPILQLLTTLPNIWGRIMGKILRLPNIIACCRNELAIGWQHERWLKNFADIHICNSQLIKEQLELIDIQQEKIFYIPNGVDTNFYVPPHNFKQSKNILCVARMVKQKNHSILLQAFSKVLLTIPEAALHFVGEGELKSEILKQANAVALRGRVYFHPPNPDLRDVYHQAGVFVLPSDYEGMPNVILEAMSCGLPVVAADIGGNSEIIENEKTGLLFPRGDCNSLAENIIRVLCRNDERLSFGIVGRERTLKHYSMSIMVSKHEAAYEYVMRRNAH
jgi:glycosyltransferase involved in cell wall biosynthesis